MDDSPNGRQDRFDVLQVARSIANASSTDLERLDKAIEDAVRTVASLREFRKVLAKQINADEPRTSSVVKKSESHMQIHKFINDNGPSTIPRIATSLGRSVQSIATSVSRSGSLSVNEDGVVESGVATN